KLLVKTEFIDKTLPVVNVSLGGYIDQSNSDKIQKVFDNLFSSQHFNLIFDFSKIVYMSSAGWGIFVGEVKRFRENGGDIKIASMDAEVYEVFQMLEFYHILEDFNTVEEALESFGVKLDKKLESTVTDEPSESEETPVMKVKPAEPATFFEKGNELYNKTQIIIRDDTKEISLTPQPLPTKKVKKKPEDGDNHRHRREQEQELDIALLPIQEKIRKIVAEFPLLNLRQIRKMLKHEDFGRHRVGLFRLHRVLKELNLETKAKRYRYYRSC
ncbi:MAG: STAS domain-containing protein, partial [bacterium]